MKTHILPLLGWLILPAVLLAGLAGAAANQLVPCPQVPNWESYGDLNYDGCVGTGQLPFPNASDHIGMTFYPPIDIPGEQYILGRELDTVGDVTGLDACSESPQCSQTFVDACSGDPACSQTFVDTCSGSPDCSQTFVDTCSGSSDCSQILLDECTGDPACSQEVVDECSEDPACSQRIPDECSEDPACSQGFVDDCSGDPACSQEVVDDCSGDPACSQEVVDDCSGDAACSQILVDECSGDSACSESLLDACSEGAECSGAFGSVVRQAVSAQPPVEGYEELEKFGNALIDALGPLSEAEAKRDEYWKLFFLGKFMMFEPIGNSIEEADSEAVDSDIDSVVDHLCGIVVPC